MDPQETNPANSQNDALHSVDQLIQAQQLDAAEARCRELVQRFPDAGEAWLRLGYVLLARNDARAAGDALAASDALARGAQLRPSDAALWVQLSIALERQGLGAEAEDAARRAIALDATKAGHWAALASALARQSRWEEATSALGQSLTIDPRGAAVWNKLAEAELKLNHLEAARQALEQAMALAPANVGPIANYAFLLCQLGRRDEAAQWLPAALGLNLAQPESWLVLGELWQMMTEWKLAETAYRQCLQIAPQHLPAQYELARTLRSLRRFTESENILSAIIQQDASHARARSLLVEVMCSQGRAQEDFVASRKAISLAANEDLDARLLIAMQYDDHSSPEALLAEHRRWDEHYARPLRPLQRPRPRPRDPGEPLRIGLLSSDFGRHPTGFLVLPALEHLDRAACQIVCYSDRTQEDDFTARFRAAASSWRVIYGQSDEQVAERIRRDGVDILVDLMGHTGKRLLVFARQPAPLQVTWFGYVGTTGLTAIDGLLADRFHVRDGEERFYSERVLRMPNGYACYGPLDNAPPVGPLPAATNSSVTFGCFNNVAKYSPQIAIAWATILERVPGSKLLLKSGAFDDEGVRRFWHDWFAARGVDRERVVLEGWSEPAELMSCYNRVDLALDTQPYSGGLTTCEALWMGVPVITFPGRTFAGRHSTSHLTNAGYGQFVAPDCAGYIDLAVAWSQQLDRLAALRSQMRERLSSSPLCDAPRFASDLRQVLTQASESRLADKRPANR